jgi:hypothetical protein
MQEDCCRHQAASMLHLWRRAFDLRRLDAVTWYTELVSTSHRYCVSLYLGLHSAVCSAVCFVLILDLIHVKRAFLIQE